MSDEKETNDGQPPTILNTVSDDTGRDDPEFTLWRAYCAQQGIDVRLLVSQLSDEQDENWNEFKRQNAAREKATN